jgi:cytochrome c nitrite reductase small subunit
MSRALKIGTIAFLMLIVIGGVGAVWLKRQIQKPDYCSRCHIMAPYYNAWKSSVFPAHTHAQLGMACRDCHEVTMGSAIRDIVSNVTHRYQIPLKEHKVHVDACFRCHSSYAKLAELTKNLKAPDGFPLGRNPHNSHWGPLECGTCHKMHRSSRDWCSECHGLRRTSAAWKEPK